MRLYIISNIFDDYTPGMAVVAARSPEEVLILLREEFPLSFDIQPPHFEQDNIEEGPEILVEEAYIIDYTYGEGLLK